MEPVLNRCENKFEIEVGLRVVQRISHVDKTFFLSRTNDFGCLKGFKESLSAILCQLTVLFV